MNVWMRRSAGVALIAAGLVAAGSTAAQAGYGGDDYKKSYKPSIGTVYAPEVSGDVTGGNAYSTVIVKDDFYNKGYTKGNDNFSGINSNASADASGHTVVWDQSKTYNKTYSKNFG